MKRPVKLPYGLELRQERRGWRKVWNGYRDGVSLDWSYGHYVDAARHMETLLAFESSLDRMGLR